MAGLPSGVVTFVFTDIEGSTPMFERLGDAYRALQERHRALLRRAWAEHGGHEIGTEGDGFFVAFADPTAAVRACVDAQRALAAEPWPAGDEIRVRMGVHTGRAEPSEGNYTALAVNAAARVMTAGNGAQIVVSETTRALVDAPGIEFVDHGPQRLRGISDPVGLCTVTAEGMAVDTRPLRATRVATTNLVVPEDELVGRGSDVDELSALLVKSRIVTITGTGGVGKTRLAVAAAANTAGEFPDGVWFVDLHALRDPDDVVAELARLVQTGDVDDLLVGIVRAIADGRVLVVLDNCEHLIAAAGEVAQAVARGCPNARVLVTSREPLGLHEETTWRTPSLPEDVAVQLLTKRIAETRGGQVPTAHDDADLRTIAVRLDGIPLALELAAARCAAMAPADVAKRLTHRFRLLTGGRGSLSRHQTLEAAVAWSVDLLDDTTRAVFRRLAVFVGGWTLDAAEAVAAIGLDAFDVDDALQALVDKSLVHIELGAAPPRYHFLETVRDFAYSELLRAGDEAEEAHGRHVAYFVGLTSELDAAIPGPAEQAATSRAIAEMENVRTAIDWAYGADDLAAAALLVANMNDPGVTSGRVLQMSAWVERALAELDAQPGAVAPALEARVLIAAARVAAEHMLGHDKVLARLRRAWDLLASDDAARDVDKAVCAGWIAQFLVSGRNYAESLSYRTAAIELLAGEPAMRAVALALLGEAQLEYGDAPDEGRRNSWAALELAQKTGAARAERIARRTLGWDASMRGDGPACAELLAPLYEPSLELQPALAVETLTDAARELIGAAEVDLAAKFAEAAVEIAARSGESEAVIDASFAAGSVAAARGDLKTAEREWQLTAELAHRHGRHFIAMLANYRLAWLAKDRGDLAAERRLTEEAEPYAIRMGHMPQMAWHTGMGEVELRSGNHALARQHFDSAIDTVRGLPPFVVGSLMVEFAETCFDLGRYEDAVRLMGRFRTISSDSALRTTGSTMRYRRRQEQDARLLAMFGPEKHAELAAEGASWDLDEIRRLVAEFTAPRNS